MCEVLRSNFEAMWPEIEGSLQEATFIALDTEFSGGINHTVHASKPSLFDSASERYSKLLHNVDGCIIIQMGVTAFRFHRDKNKYMTTTFNFYIFPQPFASVDVKFTLQSSSVEFLSRHDFDFNKFVREGVPYLSRPQVQQLQAELAGGELLQHTERMLTLEEESMLQQQCSRVCVWQDSAVPGDQLLLDDGLEPCNRSAYLPYMLHCELRSRFRTVWTNTSAGQVVVVKVSESERSQLDDRERQENTLKQQFLQCARGFSRVFDLLTNLRKPVIGHNFFMDLMFMYNQFYQPLPVQYQRFKQKISELFPAVFDTKYISFELMKLLCKEDKWKSNVLPEMYLYFKESHCQDLDMFSPFVESTNGFHTIELKTRFHEAGWDSYCTGFCFIKMTHMLAFINCRRVGYLRPLSSSEHFAAVARMKGCVNMIRARVSHVSLLGDDPCSRRPRLLYVSAKGGHIISSSHLAALFAVFGSADVKLCSKKYALVAVGSHKIARDVLAAFRSDEQLEVSLYNPLSHSPLVRALLWSGVVTCLAGCAFLVTRSLCRM